MPERIGIDTDWMTVVAGYQHFLMLKKDGSLWGWGRNDSGQLGPGPAQFTNDIVRVGRDSDWSSVFASQQTSIGVKRDGSAWKWGHLSISPSGEGSPHWKRPPSGEPIRWGLEGTDWSEFVSLWDSDLILKVDGSLWAWGNVRADLFGYSLFDADNGYRFCAQPLRIGDTSDWAAIAFNCGTLVGLKRSGAIIQFELYGPRLVCWGEVWGPSRRSDWLGIIKSDYWVAPCLALASDGTLSGWEGSSTSQLRESQRPVGPSRKPLWTINVLAKR
jgi:alpha-tubulin suppressor-like RCC1 family protein